MNILDLALKSITINIFYNFFTSVSNTSQIGGTFKLGATKTNRALNALRCLQLNLQQNFAS